METKESEQLIKNLNKKGVAMSKAKLAVVGYGAVGMRLADGAAKQVDMELVGIVDVAPTVPLRALHESGMAYDLYLVDMARKPEFDALGIPVAGSFDDVLEQVDVALDATPAGVGAKNKVLYEKHGVKAVFQAGEKNDIVDAFFHGYANYEKGIGQNYLKLTSCNTTGLVRAVDALDREVGVEKVAITIVRRVADPGDTHRGLVDVLDGRAGAQPPGRGPSADNAPRERDRILGAHAGDARPHHQPGRHPEKVGQQGSVP